MKCFSANCLYVEKLHILIELLFYFCFLMFHFVFPWGFCRHFHYIFWLGASKKILIIGRKDSTRDRISLNPRVNQAVL